MISINELVVERDGYPIFGPLSFSLKPGDICQIKGKNGAGKSSLLKTLLGLIPYQKGSINFEDALSSEHIGFIGHKLALTSLLSLKENLQYLTFGKKGIRPLDEAIEKVGLSLETDTFVSQLSEGQKKRASLARFYYLKKRLWLLDEPLTSIDIKEQSHFLDGISEYLSTGGMVIVTSHLPFKLPGHALKEVEIK